MEQMSEQMGTAERSYAKIIKPDTPSGRMAEWSTIKLALDVLGRRKISIEWGEPGVNAGTRRRINAERRQRQGSAMPQVAA
jgi:hypothetical protein